MSKELKKRSAQGRKVVKEEVRKDVFDLADWLAEHSLSQGEDWEPYRGRKEYCDIRLRDGTEIGPCWPNCDFIDLTDDLERAIPYKDVVRVRYYDAITTTSEPVEEEDDEDEEVVGGVRKEPNPDPDDD